MLINFALDCIGTIATSDKVSRDGHECTNLVSNHWQTRKKGFIAEHFIKPPVNITFQFPCSIQIYQIFVTPYVGQQLSSQVEIYSAARPKHSNSYGKQNQQIQSGMISPEGKIDPLSGPAVSNSKPGSGASPASTKSPPPLFYQVSKVSVSDYGCICFTNNTFSSPSESVCSVTPEDGNQCMFRNTMQHHRRELLSAASHVSVRLVYTRRGSSVAVRNIEIWGVPAFSVPASIKNNIVASFTAYIKPRSEVSTAHHHGSNKSTTEDPKSLDNEKITDAELTIPEEFFDPLTCEVMSIPMLLPCGKNVDLSSLNRFFDSEASHGRAPRDPFTGVVFSENSKPISNIALKSRIDQFLFKHRNDRATSSVARTVNGQSETGIRGKRDANGERLLGRISTLVSPSRNGMKTTPMPTSTLCTPNPRKHTLLSDASLKESDSKRQLSNETASIIKPEKPVVSERSSDCPSSSQGNSKSHEQELKDSLYGALASIIGGTSFKDREENTLLQQHTLVPVKCSTCNNLQAESAILYNSPCNHTICRQCLTSQLPSSCTNIKCGACGRICKRQDFVRKHQI